jgi:hypothetical protein
LAEWLFSRRAGFLHAIPSLLRIGFAYSTSYVIGGGPGGSSGDMFYPYGLPKPLAAFAFPGQLLLLAVGFDFEPIMDLPMAGTLSNMVV